MAKVDTLTREACYNPYFCFNKEVKQIVIFAYGKEIARTDRGWLTVKGGGSNNEEFTALEEMQVYNKRKVDLNFGRSFMVKDVLYVHTSDLPCFKDLGEEIANEFTHETNYGHFVQFMTGARYNAKPHTVRVMMGTYTRSVPTNKGKEVKALRDLLESIGCVDASRYNVEKMIKHKDQIVELLTK